MDERIHYRMIDVGSKPTSERTAVASGHIRMSPETFERIRAPGLRRLKMVRVEMIEQSLDAERASMWKLEHYVDGDSEWLPGHALHHPD